MSGNGIKIRFLSDAPISSEEQDFFKIHTNVANALFRIIEDAELGTGAFAVGLYGGWGAGKTTVIKLLLGAIERRNTETDFHYVPLYFDVWKFSKEPLKRGILFEMESQLKQLADKLEDKAADFRQAFLEYKYGTAKGSFGLKELLEFETSYEEEVKLDDEELKGIVAEFKNWLKNVFLNWKMILVLAGLLLITISSWLWWKGLFDVLKFVWSILVSLGIIGLFSGVVSTELMPMLKKIMFKRAVRNLTARLAFSGEQFEKIFEDMIQKAQGGGSRKIVVIFDNLDRCEKDHTLEILSTLKTYLDISGCLYVIACDDNALRQHLQSAYGERPEFSRGFLDKLFQVTFRIPLLVEDDRNAFIKECISELGLPLDADLEREVRQVLTLAYRGQTPREIKRYLNDFALYYLAARTIEESDPNWEKTRPITSNMGFFSFAVALKQVWPWFEEFLVEQPDALEKWRKNIVEENKDLQEILNSTFQSRKPQNFETLSQFLKVILPALTLPPSLSPYLYLKPRTGEEALTKSVRESLWSGDSKYWQELKAEELEVALAIAKDLLQGWLAAKDTVYIQNAVRVLWNMPLKKPKNLGAISVVFCEALEILDDNQLMSLLQEKEKHLGALFGWLESVSGGRRERSINRLIKFITLKEAG